MTHNEIIARYTAITSEFREQANQAHMVYGEANKNYDKAMAELQALCDHRAPKTDFIDGVACPFCHKPISFLKENNA